MKQMSGNAALARLLAMAWLLSIALVVNAGGPAPTPKQADYEIDFMVGMIDHHEMAVRMADSCEEKATHAELAALCTDIKLAQQQEISMMQQWLLGWYGIAYSPQMKPGAMRRMEKLEQLSGAEYEIEFLQTMIKHHRMAVREGSVCLENAYHGELESLCTSIIENQLLEIQMMRAWLCDWYGICRNKGA